MNTRQNPAGGPDDPFFHAHAVSLSVSTIRKAQRKLLPRDCQEGTEQWLKIMEEFAHDVTRALAAL